MKRIGVVGLGLIGGSVASGLKKRKLVEQIIGYDKDAASLASALEAGVIDCAASSVADSAKCVDIMIIAVPVLSVQSILEQIPLNKIITDVGSVKAPIIEASRIAYGKVPEKLVPGHPIAGSEKQGITSANPDLFENHMVILTPLKSTDENATEIIRKLWQSLGSQVIEMSAARHDNILAQTSHLPHLLAYALVEALSSRGDNMEVLKFAAGGFRDFSRIAASDPIIWRDIFKANRSEVIKALDRFLEEISLLRQLVLNGDSDAMEKVFRRARKARNDYLKQFQEYDS
ncbi:MAG: prephenate dehydrogenase/arogenate dehydrogenase family protein [Gammaproteobacteria bacterium TMED1]|nr:MAG: prephenate dehydrogenase/arogenate dehydrogenase family protein [Gammaproteobacteria bacterium TMED1]|tara:strand:- start:432 stop:1295 length:864 start_codon:yes stop_codon:yes gene_type:complete